MEGLSRRCSGHCRGSPFNRRMRFFMNAAEDTDAVFRKNNTAAFPAEDTEDTIAAVATAMSEAGIGIIRISGPAAAVIGSRLYRTPADLQEGTVSRIEDWKPGTIRYGYIVDSRGEVIDEVMLSWMKAPHSYTTRDTVEINTHGGLFVMERVLGLVLQAGARLAEPGEFTKQAFLGGRIDLSRAEAVMDLIGAGSEYARRVSMAQLRGSLSGKVRQLREEILYEMAYIESALDDPDSYDLEGYPERLRGIIQKEAEELDGLLAHAEDGRILQEGIHTVILGRPNAGKSSLLNLLAGEERAIVTEIPGTTRDVLRERIRLGELALLVSDTAGIRDTEDLIEEIGVRRAREAAREADLILWILDAAQPLSPEDRQIGSLVRECAQGGSRCVVLLNKQDLDICLQEKDLRDLEQLQDLSLPILSFSARTGEGLRELERTVGGLFHVDTGHGHNEVLLTAARHKEAAGEALQALRLVLQSIDAGLSEDFYTIDMMTAYTALGRILGEAVEDDLVDEIFSRFCMGK